MDIIENVVLNVEIDETHEEIKVLKELFFEKLFIQTVNSYTVATDGKYFDLKIECTIPSLSNFFQRQFSKYKYKTSYHDFIFECMKLTYEAIHKFHIKDAGTWQGIVSGVDKVNLGRLIKNIKTTVEFEIIRFVNDNVKFTRGKYEGKNNQHIKVKYDFTSLESLLISSDGEEKILLEKMSNENYFWGNHGESYSIHFVKWFRENKEKILTKVQLKLLENLEKCQHDNVTNSYTINDCEKVTGIPSYKLKTYYERIKKRIYKAWEQEKKIKTHLEMHKEQQINLLCDLLAVVESGMDKDVSDWIVGHLDHELISNLVFDNLSGEESKRVNFVYQSDSNEIAIDNRILYKIINAVHEKLDKLLEFNTDAVAFYRTNEEMGKWTVKAQKEYEKYMKKIKNSPCKVYGKKTFDAEQEKASIEYKELFGGYEEVKSNIFKILPTGILVEIDDFADPY